MEDGKPRMLTSHTLNPVGSTICAAGAATCLRALSQYLFFLLVCHYEDGPGLSVVDCGHVLSQLWCKLWKAQHVFMAGGMSCVALGHRPNPLSHQQPRQACDATHDGFKSFSPALWRA